MSLTKILKNDFDNFPYKLNVTKIYFEKIKNEKRFIFDKLYDYEVKTICSDEKKTYDKIDIYGPIGLEKDNFTKINIYYDKETEDYKGSLWLNTEMYKYICNSDDYVSKILKMFEESRKEKIKKEKLKLKKLK